MTAHQPMELVRPLTHDEATHLAIREAIQAALDGDLGKADELELAYLNVLVRVGELFVKLPDGTPHWWFDRYDARFGQVDWERFAPFVISRLRHHGPRASAALEWSLMEKCRRCAGKLRRLACPVCGGRWYRPNDAGAGTVITGLDGIVLEDCSAVPEREDDPYG